MNLEFTVTKTFDCMMDIDFQQLMGYIEADYTSRFLAGLWRLAKANPDSFDIEELDSDDFPLLLDDDVEGLDELIIKHYPAGSDLWETISQETAEDQDAIGYCEQSSSVEDVIVNDLS